MKFVMNLFISFLFAAVLFGCNKNDSIPEVEPDFQIEFKTQCGWCAGIEMITITQDKIEYLRHIPCGETEGTTQKHRSISLEERNLIISSYSFNIFETLNYSECNICFDGCDEVITISKDKRTHEISYSPNTNIKEIKDLQELLSDLLIEMREMD